MGITLFGDQAPVNPTEQQFGFENLTSGIAAGTAAEDALANSPVAEINRTTALNQAENGVRYGFRGLGVYAPESPLLPPDIANQNYGIKGTLSWDKPVRDETAKLQNQFATDRIKRDDILRRSQSGILPSTARMAATLGASMLDPINIAASFVPVVGEARFATLGAIGSRLARGAVEGAVGQALIEPINLANADSEQRDYDMGQVLQDVAFGAGLGATLHLGAYGLKRSAGYVRDILHGVPEFTPPADHAAALSGAISALSEDRPVRVAEYLASTDIKRQSERLPIDRRDALMGDSALSGTYAPEAHAAILKLNQHVDIGTGNDEYAGLISSLKSAADNGLGVEIMTKDGRRVRLVNAEDATGARRISAFDDNGNEVGNLKYSIGTEPSGKRINPDVDVKEEWKRQGIGSALYDLAEQTGGKIPAIDQAGQIRSDEAIAFRTDRAKKQKAAGLPITEDDLRYFDKQQTDQFATAVARQSAITDLPDTAGTSFADAWQQMTKAQMQSHAVQPDHAIAMSEWDREAPIAKMRQDPERAASEAESYAQQTDDVLQGIRDKGLLAPEHEAVLAAEDENIRMAEQRGKGLTQAAACIGRALE